MKPIYILIFLLSFLSCDNEEKSAPYPKSNSYINSYLTKPEKYQAIVKKHGEELLFKILIEGNNAIYPEYDFKQFAEYYDDTNFSNDGYLPTNVYVFSDSIIKIDITCNSDYNVNYKKDELLNAIASIRYSSYNNFIKSGYDLSVSTDFDIPLSLFNTQNHKLVNSFFEFALSELPSSSEFDSFTITINYKDNIFKIVTDKIDLK